MNKYRTKYEIIHDILVGMMEEKSRTRIMYDGYLSYTQLKEYLAHLLENGLISKPYESEQYVITEKGKKYIEQFKTLHALIS